jgi:hypothetical protein
MVWDKSDKTHVVEIACMVVTVILVVERDLPAKHGGNSSGEKRE